MRRAIVNGKRTELGLPMFGQDGRLVGWDPVSDPENYEGVWRDGAFVGYRPSGELPHCHLCRAVEAGANFLKELRLVFVRRA